MWRTTTVFCIAVAAVAALLAGCSESGNREQQAAQGEAAGAGTAPSLISLSPASCKEVGLVVEAVSGKPCTRMMTIPAKILANQDREALVGSLVAGRVCEISVRTGDRVKAGDVLMRVEGLEIGEIKAAYLSARANLRYQEKNLERQKKLFEENVGARKDYLEVQNEYEKARAEFTAGKNRVLAVGLEEADIERETNGQDSGRCRNAGSLVVRSPISGIVSERNVVTGQYIEATTNAFRIMDLASVWADGQIYEKDIGKVAAGASVRFRSSAVADLALSGKISFVGQVIDEKTRTITVRAVFDNNGGLLKPQMFGEMDIASDKKTTAIVIPAEAVVKMDNTDIVFVKKTESEFEKRAVTVAASRNDSVEIDGGIADGENVVVRGAFYLKAELLKGSLGEGE